MSNYQFEDVTVPKGAYISWGNHVGQTVFGKVIDYDQTGGTDFNDDPCPQLQVELIEPAKSINKHNEISDYAAGEFVVLNCGQVSLKRAVKAAQPEVGDVVKITLQNLVKTAKGTVKEFAIQIARGQGSVASAAKPVAQAANPFA